MPKKGRFVPSSVDIARFICSGKEVKNVKGLQKNRRMSKLCCSLYGLTELKAQATVKR